jgi:hypothetical protein
VYDLSHLSEAVEVDHFLSIHYVRAIAKHKIIMKKAKHIVIKKISKTIQQLYF